MRTNRHIRRSVTASKLGCVFERMKKTVQNEDKTTLLSFSDFETRTGFASHVLSTIVVVDI